MPAPENVNPSKFTVEVVLYNHNDFSVAYGTWHPSEGKAVVMRWNDGDDGNGYPKTFGNPQWFVVSDDISRSILSGLLTNPMLLPTEYQAILEVLKRL